MIKKILQAVVFGLFCAAIVLYVYPWAKEQWKTEPEILSYQKAVKEASPAVVNIYTKILNENNNAGYLLNLGSGVIMTANGYILTNKHVIQDGEEITVYLQNGEHSVAHLVGSDTLTDLAVLKVDGVNMPTIRQNPKRIPQVGDIVLAIGNPYNLGQSVSQGIISATGRNTISDRTRQNLIQTDAPISKGNSGGALINTAGELIGINTVSLKNSGEIRELSIAGTDSIAEGLNFAIPINQASDVMNKIIKDGRVIRGYFGVNTVLTNAFLEKGVLITAVTKDSPAEKAGIQQGDIMLSVGNIEAKSPSQMMEALANIKPGTVVRVLVLRGDVELAFNVTIGEFPDN